MRPIGYLLPHFVPHGFFQIHREYVVNLRQIRQIRRRDDSRDWEVKLEPPVNRILPVSRGAVAKLWKAFEDELANGYGPKMIAYLRTTSSR